MEGFAGVIAMDWSVAEVTVSAVAPLIAPRAALMLVVPAATVLARPLEPAALEIVAAAVLEEAQVTWVVRSWVVPSVKMPVALKARVSGTGRLGLGGVTWIVARVAGVTVRVAGPLTAPSVAEMVVVPTARVVAKPWDPAALEMVATLVIEYAQVTCVVRSWVEPSVKVPVAVNCSGLPFATEGVGGETERVCSAAAVTVSWVEPVIPLIAAEMEVLPTSTVLTRPWDPAALEMVATLVIEDAQLTCVVRSWVEPSV